MGMFFNYQSISDNYTPNNLVDAFPSCEKKSKLAPADQGHPFEEYNAKGEVIGYFWRQGETLDFEFNIDGEIAIEPDAILMSTVGSCPTEKTMGCPGQRAYNVLDFRSWTCVSSDGTIFTWIEDEQFTHPPVSSRNVYISAEDYMRGKTATITLYNFRMESVYQKTYPASPRITLSITPEVSKLFVKGVYYCSVVVSDELVSQTIFDPQDCTFLVK